MPFSDPLALAADRYWSALAGDDAEAAQEVVARAIAGGVPAADALTGIVVRAQQLIGHTWAANIWTVGQEHSATAISEQVVARVVATLPPPDRNRRPLLVACAEREFHSLAAQVVTASFRSWGWPAEFAGADTRSDLLQHRIAELRPAAVLISASLSSVLTRAARQFAVVTATGTPVIAGGAAFDAAGLRATRLGASGYAATPAAARTLLETLPDVVIPPPLVIDGEVERLEALAGQLARTVLEATIPLLETAPDAVSPDHWQVVLATFTPHLVASVAGGVLTDDPTVPAAARAWLDETMRRRGAPPDVTEVLWDQLRAGLDGFPACQAIVGLTQPGGV